MHFKALNYSFWKITSTSHAYVLAHHIIHYTGNMACFPLSACLTSVNTCRTLKYETKMQLELYMLYTLDAYGQTATITAIDRIGYAHTCFTYVIVAVSGLSTSRL